MNTKSYSRNDYGAAEAKHDLGGGVHPEVVAVRLGEPVSHVLKAAKEHEWPVLWRPHPLPSPDQMIERFNRLYGFNA